MGGFTGDGYGLEAQAYMDSKKIPSPGQLLDAKVEALRENVMQDFAKLATGTSLSAEQVSELAPIVADIAAQNLKRVI